MACVAAVPRLRFMPGLAATFRRLLAVLPGWPWLSPAPGCFRRVQKLGQRDLPDERTASAAVCQTVYHRDVVTLE